MYWKDHLISANQFDAEQIRVLFDVKIAHKLSDKRIATLFYEDSVRTRASFEAAAHNLGVGVITITQDLKQQYSSVSKGADLEDTIKTLAQYVDLVVLRHPDSWAAERAAALDVVPIINAGCGDGEHPTQGLLDLYTIMQYQPSMEFNITFFGDNLNSRTVHSLIQLLSLYKNDSKSPLGPNTYTSKVFAYYVSHDGLQVPQDLAPLLSKKLLRPDQISDALPFTDVLYVTRLQSERGSEGNYKLTMDGLNMLPKHSIVMHPFPRVDELPKAFDDDPRAKYFEQIANGLHVRTLILHEMLKGK